MLFVKKNPYQKVYQSNLLQGARYGTIWDLTNKKTITMPNYFNYLSSSSNFKRVYITTT
jgi:hypothetical protein